MEREREREPKICANFRFVRNIGPKPENVVAVRLAIGYTEPKKKSIFVIFNGLFCSCQIIFWEFSSFERIFLDRIFQIKVLR